jgi:hypothetical protein
MSSEISPVVELELYALGNDRTARFARVFLDHYLPAREPAQADYPVPEHADDPRVVFETEDEILEYLEARPAEPYGLYWNTRSNGFPRMAMLFYTRDGKVIFGLADQMDDPVLRLRDHATFVGAEYSVIQWEERPPETSHEFIEVCERGHDLGPFWEP